MPCRAPVACCDPASPAKSSRHLANSECHSSPHADCKLKWTIPHRSADVACMCYVRGACHMARILQSTEIHYFLRTPPPTRRSLHPTHLLQSALATPSGWWTNYAYPSPSPQAASRANINRPNGVGGHQLIVNVTAISKSMQSLTPPGHEIL